MTNIGKIKKRSNNSGFTMIEVLVAIAIFSLGFMSIMALQSGALMKSGDIARKTEAWVLLDAQAETLKGIPFYANNNNEDDDGDGLLDETDELFKDDSNNIFPLGAGQYNVASEDGRFVVHWRVVDDEPFNGPHSGKWDNLWSASPAHITLSKTVTVAVTEPGGDMDSDAIALVQFVRTFAEEGML